MTVVAILQARVSSKRLPGKVLAPILGLPMIERQIERIDNARLIERLIVATSLDPMDDAVAKHVDSIGVECFRGSLHDVLDRCYNAAKWSAATTVVRLTGDCPLADWEIIDSAIQLHKEGEFEYTSNSVVRTFPRGLDVEVMTFDALSEAWREARLPSEREHVTPFLWRQPERYPIGKLVQGRDHSHQRWTVDEPADLEFVRAIYEALYTDNPCFTSQDIMDLLEIRPELIDINAKVAMDTGEIRSEKEDRKFVQNHPFYRK